MFNIDVIKNNHRYKDFKYVEKPYRFCDLFEGFNISVVQIHSATVYKTPYGEQVIGFVGAFSFNDGVITSLDGDEYYKTTIVYGYKWFESANGSKCLDIIVGEDW